MSVSFHAMSIVGVRLLKPPFQTKEVRGCRHEITIDVDLKRGAKFCGECGKRTWLEEMVPLPIYDPSTETIKPIRDGFPRGSGFDVLRGGNYEAPTYYVGLYPLETDDLNYSPPGKFSNLRDFDLPSLTARLKGLLEPHGLWKDAEDGTPMQVGLWTFGCCG